MNARKFLLESKENRKRKYDDSACNLLPVFAESLELESSKNSKLQPSSTIFIRNEKKRASSSCDFTKTPNLFVKLQITNLDEIPPADLWNSQVMWKHRMVDLTAVLNTNNHEQNEIGMATQNLAFSYLKMIQQRKETLQLADKEQESGPSKKRAKKLRDWCFRFVLRLLLRLLVRTCG